MKEKLFILAATSLLLVPSVPALADEKDDRIAELEAQIEEMQATIDDLQAQLEKYTTASDQDSYKIGDTWTVPGQWTLTVDSVEEVSERNEYADTDPAAVYLITYTYENLGYEAEGMNGLYIDFMDGIVDASGKMGCIYPGDITMYPQEAPVGSTCEAQSCVGVDNLGSFEIHFSTYDGAGVEQSATFVLDVEE